MAERWLCLSSAQSLSSLSLLDPKSWSWKFHHPCDLPLISPLRKSGVARLSRIRCTYYFCLAHRRFKNYFYFVGNVQKSGRTRIQVSEFGGEVKRLGYSGNTFLPANKGPRPTCLTRSRDFNYNSDGTE